MGYTNEGVFPNLFALLSICLLLYNCADKVDDLPKNIDHLVYTAPTLEQGINEIEKLLGTKPILGGRHPKYGTHNALLSLGKTTYLEIIAPDPELPVPEKGRLLSSSYDQRPKLTTWVIREEQIEKVRLKAVDQGLPLGIVESGQREKPDGTVLAWKLTDPYAFPLNGSIPFLISWGNTPHPAQAVPMAGELVGLEIEHPEPQAVREKLKILNVNIKVSKGPEPKLRARIMSDNGIVILE